MVSDPWRMPRCSERDIDFSKKYIKKKKKPTISVSESVVTEYILLQLAGELRTSPFMSK